MMSGMYVVGLVWLVATFVVRAALVALVRREAKHVWGNCSRTRCGEGLRRCGRRPVRLFLERPLGAPQVAGPCRRASCAEWWSG
jgi:hypothetical protein